MFVCHQYCLLGLSDLKEMSKKMLVMMLLNACISFIQFSFGVK